MKVWTRIKIGIENREEYQLRESLSSYSPRLRHSSFLRTSTVDITTRELVITTRELVTNLTSTSATSSAQIRWMHVIRHNNRSATSSESTSDPDPCVTPSCLLFGIFMLVISGCLSNVLSTTMTITEWKIVRMRETYVLRINTDRKTRWLYNKLVCYILYCWLYYVSVDNRIPNYNRS